MRLAYDDLLSRQAQTSIETLDCTSGWFTTQNWQGIWLVDVLEEAGLLARAAGARAGFHHRVWPYLPNCRTAPHLLATHTGGQPLDAIHGAPLRAVVPGRRGWFWVKWLVTVEALTTPAEVAAGILASPRRSTETMGTVRWGSNSNDALGPNGGVFLDISHRDKNYILQKLPRMYRQFMESQMLDISRQPMEVAPTAHYSMGGVVVEPETHTTGVEGLYAAGEVTSGVHGANRLGGNSLVETLVFGRRAGEAAAAYSQALQVQLRTKRSLMRPMTN